MKRSRTRRTVQRSRNRVDTKSGLTSRELEVAMMLVVGKTNWEIAEKYGLSVKTVDTHRGNALARLGLRNNVELTLHALRHGWFVLDPGDTL